MPLHTITPTSTTHSGANEVLLRKVTYSSERDTMVASASQIQEPHQRLYVANQSNFLRTAQIAACVRSTTPTLRKMC